MNEIFDIYTLIFLVLAVVIVIRIRNVLGTKTGNERQIDHFSPREKSKDSDNADASSGAESRQDNVIPLPGTAQDHFTETATLKDEDELEEALNKHAPEGTDLRAALLLIMEKDPEFDPDNFLNGAKMAYEMIVTSFAEGNKKQLKQLLSSDVLDGFMSAVKDRESRGESIDSSFVGIEKAKLIDAELRDKSAHVTVKFVSSMITATLNAAAEVIDGDPKKVRRVTDIWTFARKTNSRDPNWKLVATESAN